MRVSSFVSITTAIAATCSAFPQWTELHESGLTTRAKDPHFFRPPGPGDVRSPCPGHNTLANHGYINRNGKNITKAAVQQGFLDAFQMVFNATVFGADSTLNLCSALTGQNCSHFDLDMLAFPHSIEHDGSLTRTDKMLKTNPDANNQAFDKFSFARSLEIYGNVSHINVSLANTVRLTRFADMERQDVDGWFIPNHGGSSTEHAFILYTMNDVKVANYKFPQARMDWFKYWMTNQRLPTALGWQKPTAFPSSGYIIKLARSVVVAPTITTALPVYTEPPPATITYTSSFTRPFKARAAEPTTDVVHSKVVAGIQAVSATSAAASIASAKVGPGPSPLNAYASAISPQQWKQYQEDIAQRGEEFKQEYHDALNNILADIPA